MGASSSKKGSEKPSEEWRKATTLEELGYKWVKGASSSFYAYLRECDNSDRYLLVDDSEDAVQYEIKLRTLDGGTCGLRGLERAPKRCSLIFRAELSSTSP